MRGLPLLIILITMLVYLDFVIWYCAEMHKWNDKNMRKFRGVLWRFWDFLGKE